MAERCERTNVEVDLATEGAANHFFFTDPTAWEIVEVDGEHVLSLKASSDYKPPHRSPLSIALVKAPEFADFMLTADLEQTGREYGHRDLCLFFGFESKSRYYYTHLATTPDQNAHNVFLVDGAARKNLLPPREKGVDWGTGARHRVRVERVVKTGRIRVFFDDMKKPVFDVIDKTISSGRIGFGSFDDTGRFSNIAIDGVVVDRPPAKASGDGGDEGQEAKESPREVLMTDPFHD